MLIDLKRPELEAMVKGSSPNYSQFNHPVVIKAGHSYSDQYGHTTWNSLDKLTNGELLLLYVICRDSWKEEKKEEKQ